jgi:hypothetical protein
MFFDSLSTEAGRVAVSNFGHELRTEFRSQRRWLAPVAGYDDVNDAERLRHDPAMHWIVGGKAAHLRFVMEAILRRVRRRTHFSFPGDAVCLWPMRLPLRANDEEKTPGRHISRACPQLA